VAAYELGTVETGSADLTVGRCLGYQLPAQATGTQGSLADRDRRGQRRLAAYLLRPARAGADVCEVDSRQ
jgi:hypothetical protein